MALTHPSGRVHPPLRGGEHLTRAEFEARYDATPELKKAELIDGVVYMPPPVSQDAHSGPHFRLIGWLSMYQIRTPGVDGGDNGSLRLDLHNEPQPDAFLYILPANGGQAQIDEDGYVVGGPELVAEVAATTTAYDLRVKKEIYRRHRVREYLVWRVLDQMIDWFVLAGDDYALLMPDSDGTCRSRTFPGLWLDPASLARRDMVRVADIQQAGLATAEHAAFVKRLQAAS